MLEKINNPSDLKGLSIDELEQLCADVRKYMVECCSQNPGHLGSSLGAVEIIAALHYVYNTPEDKIVFDVGHQAYAHKILTGRKEAFRNIRKEGGISGFPRPDESPYDAFSAGHSSTSISAALGFAEAARMQGSGAKAVAVIGDGALTGGLALEGLNNAGASSADLLVILNDNNQSIDSNKGALHSHLLNLTTSRAYNHLKGIVWDTLGEGRVRRFFSKATRTLKSGAVKDSGGDMFEALGFRYFGPVDGNDIHDVVQALTRLRSLKGPRVLHCITRKGKGYAPAEADPVVWHAPGKFDPETGERVVPNRTIDRYQDVFGQTLVDLARTDARVVGVTPAMSTGCGMNLLETQVPDRFYDVGIEEEHAVTFSAGLAAGGMRPFCNIYSSFSQRAYDQIIHDVALQHLPVVMCFDRAGVVGEDGATHNGAFDLAAYRSIPGAIVSAPSNELELRNLMYSALQSETGPYIIRYPRGAGEGVEWREKEFESFPAGKASCVLEGGEGSVAVLALGPSVNAALKAAEEFPDGAVSVYDMRFLKPLDFSVLETVSRCKAILTLEDGCLSGGLHGAVSEWFAAKGIKSRIVGHGMPDEFVRHATQSAQRARCGLDKESIVRTLEELMAE